MPDGTSAAGSPRDLAARFARSFNESDIDALASMFDPDAVQIAGDGVTELRSPEAIRGALESFSATFSTIEQEFLYAIENGDWALMRTRYVLVPREAGAQRLQGSTVEVLRRDPALGWRYYIDHPFGANPP